jgi:hypothetical protein
MSFTKAMSCVRGIHMSASGRRVTSYVAQAEHAIDTFSHAGPFRPSRDDPGAAAQKIHATLWNCAIPARGVNPPRPLIYPAIKTISSFLPPRISPSPTLKTQTDSLLSSPQQKPPLQTLTMAEERPSLRLGSIAPNFEADTTQGRINFHDWIGDQWCVFFSHPEGS